MTYKLQLCLIRDDVVTVELLDIDDLGRQVGAAVEVQSVVSAELRTAIDAHIADAIAAQTDVIAEAKTIRQSDPTAEVVLVAGLKSVRIPDAR